MGILQSCCPEDFSRECPVEFRSPGRHQLCVAAWNAASGDKRFKDLARPQDCARDMLNHCNDIVICTECNSTTQTAFQNVGYESIHFSTLLTICGLSRCPLACCESIDCCVKKTYGVRIFYRPQTLRPSKARGPQVKEIPGVTRNGTVVSQLFEHVETKEKVLVTGVHAGHYGNSKKLVRGKVSDDVRETAERLGGSLGNFLISLMVQQRHIDKFWAPRQGMEQIRDMQRDMWKQDDVGKVIVGGDFNELGDLIFEFSNWTPLPYRDRNGNKLPNVQGTLRAENTLQKIRVTADHIWVGGHAVNPEVKQGRGKDYGSDHHSVWMRGI
eukprot:Skav203954  [mRNA]  locus=scaffold391:386813:387864:- [translate_table: standard]